MRQNFVVEGEPRQLDWERLQPPFVLRLGEERLEVVHHRPGFCLLSDGRCLRYTSQIAASSQEWTFQWQGQTLSVRAVRSQQGHDSAGAESGLVKSPMNGVVVKVLATAGQMVEAGQVILVLEAMKMENEVTAPLSGLLQRCEVSAGQVVTANQFLFEVVNQD